MTNSRRFLFLTILSAGGLLFALGGRSEEAETKMVDVFTLPSIHYEVLAVDKGYFPVMNRWEDRLFAVIRAGAGHIGIGGRLELLRSFPNRVRWEDPLLVVDSDKDDRNPAVGFTSTGRLITGYMEQGSYDENGKYMGQDAFSRARCMVTFTDDFGDTWSAPQSIDVAGLDHDSPYGRIIQTRSGALLMNVYGPYAAQVPGTDKVRSDSGDYAYLVRSEDNGATWSGPALIAAGHNETALLQLADGRLLAAGRTSSVQRLDAMLSTDEGRTWTEPLRLTGPSQHPADLIRLSNGWILLIYGDRSREEKTIRGLISRDACRTWDIQYTILFSRPARGDFGYPSIVALADGRLAIVHYITREVLNGGEKDQTRAVLTTFREQELIEAYQKMVGS